MRTARASCILWRSPVESVTAERSSERYPSPRSIRRLAVSSKESHMLTAIGRISSGRLSGTPRTQSTSSERDIVQTWSREILRSFG